MAIKKRLLLNLRSIYVSLGMISRDKPRGMHSLLQRLTEAQSLCQKGLPETAYRKYGEIYDGLLMAFRQIQSGEASGETREIFSLCSQLLDFIIEKTAGEERFKKEIVFLPYKASMWDCFESIWQATEEDWENCIAYVIPIPYGDRNPDGTAREWHCESGLFPKYVPVMDWQSVDLMSMHPEVIFICNPYDDRNAITSVDSRYYSRSLRSCTDCLVYIPYYTTAGNMADSQSSCPAYRQVDYIVIQAEKYRKFFDASIPDEKFLPLGSPKFDKVVRLCNNPPEPPPEWKEKMRGRKVFFYNTSLAGFLECTPFFLQKLEYVFSIFRHRTDACLLWRPHPLLEATLKSMREKYIPEFERIRDQYIAEGFGIYDMTPDIEKTIALSDAYIGDSGTSVTSLFGMAGKPIFYLNNMIQQLPEKDDWLGQINRVWLFLPRDWLIVHGNQLWHAPEHDLHFHYACDLSSYGGGGYYGSLLELEGKLFVCPNNAQDILVVEDEKITGKISLDRKMERAEAFAGATYVYQEDEDYFFLMPIKYPAIVRYDFRHGRLDYVPYPDEVFVQEVASEKWRGAVFHWREWLIFSSATDSRGFAVNRHSLETQEITICHDSFTGSMFALCREWGENEYFFFPYRGRKATRWNVVTGEVQEYDFPENFKCVHPARGTVSDIRPFTNGIFQDENTILLAPLWGNMFVKLHIDTGVMEEWKTPFRVTPEGKNGYYFAGMVGFFIAEPDMQTATWRPKSYQFYYSPERRRYHFDPETEKFTLLEQDAVIDEAELRSHMPGFCQMSEYEAYGCWEDAFNSLQDFVDGHISGGQFDRNHQLESYRKIAANSDGTAGEKIYAYIRDHGKGGAR